MSQIIIRADVTLKVNCEKEIGLNEIIESLEACAFVDVPGCEMEKFDVEEVFHVDKVIK
jgi:hypothetical protein